MPEVLSLKKYYRFLMWICLWVSFQQSTGIALEFVICLVLIIAESLRLVSIRNTAIACLIRVPYTNIYLTIGFRDSCSFLQEVVFVSFSPDMLLDFLRWKIIPKLAAVKLPIISFWVGRITACRSTQIRCCSSWSEYVHKRMKMLDPSLVIVRK